MSEDTNKLQDPNKQFKEENRQMEMSRGIQMNTNFLFKILQELQAIHKTLKEVNKK